MINIIDVKYIGSSPYLPTHIAAQKLDCKLLFCCITFLLTGYENPINSVQNDILLLYLIMHSRFNEYKFSTNLNIYITTIIVKYILVYNIMYNKIYNKQWNDIDQVVKI